jgi:acetyl-CoA carboxylase biotin carboxyl carrier protein
MTDSDDALEAINRAAETLVPALTERLTRHGLGEIEVRQGDLRLRVAGTPHLAGRPTAPVAEPATSTTGGDPAAGRAAASSSAPGAPPATAVGITSPAVGFFVYADGLGPGQAVAKGDAVGHVEMLGVRHDVRAPRGGTVRHLVAESGEPVEYGQVVVEIEPVEAPR